MPAPCQPGTCLIGPALCSSPSKSKVFPFFINESGPHIESLNSVPFVSFFCPSVTLGYLHNCPTYTTAYYEKGIAMMLGTKEDITYTIIDV